ncbi:MAG: hypothetical protein R3C03_11760 [Pirellulaceae bacterium]
MAANELRETSESVTKHERDYRYFLEQSAKVISESRQITIAGTESLSISAQRAVLELAMLVGASIHSSISDGGGLSSFLLQNQGLSTATLGEISDRCDTIVFWDIDPNDLPPKLIPKYFGDRKIVFVSNRDQSDFEIDSSGNFITCSLEDATTYLGCLLSDKTGALPDSKECTLQSVFEKSNHLAVFATFSRITSDTLPHFSLVNRAVLKKNREGSRAYLLNLEKALNHTGAIQVNAAHTGFCDNMDYSAGYWRQHWSDISLSSLLRREIVDTVVVFCGQNQRCISELISKHSNINWILFHSVPFDQPLRAIQIEIAALGIDDSGDVLRMDEVMIPVPATAASSRPRQRVLRPT